MAPSRHDNQPFHPEPLAANFLRQRQQDIQRHIDGAGRELALKVATLGAHTAEKAVSLFYEKVLHKQTASDVWVSRCRTQISGGLAALEPDRVPEPKRHSARARHPVVVAGSALFTLVLLAAVAAGVALTFGKQRFEAPGPLIQEKMVNIPRGAGVRDIAPTIPSPWPATA